MKEFKGKVAVITGAASGIGLGLAGRCAREGMKVVLSDVEENALREAEAKLRSEGATVLAVVTDVSKVGDVEALAHKTLSAFGGVHFLFNNAGVNIPGEMIWDQNLPHWQWVIGVNLWGVIHGVKIFLPIMLKQEEPSHIVNTASAAGLFSIDNSAVYSLTKHAVVSLSETLYLQLKTAGANVNASVFCPGMVNTRFYDPERNSPAELQVTRMEMSPEEKENHEARKKVYEEKGMTSDVAADMVLDAVRKEKFYILTHPGIKIAIKERMENILQERNPVNPIQTQEDFIKIFG